MKYKDIPQLTGWGKYAVDVELARVPVVIAQYQEEQGLQLLPDFQRGHVWTRKQQIAYIEFLLKGGRSGGMSFSTILAGISATLRATL